MNKNIKRRMYALALASIMVVLPKTKGFAEEVDMSNVIDIDQAISELVPNDVPSNNPSNSSDENNNNNNNNNSNNNNENNNNNNNNENNNNNSNNTNDTENNKNSNNNEDKKDNINKDEIESNNNNEEIKINNENNQNNSISQSNCEHSFSTVADDVINQVTPSCTVGGSYTEIYKCTKCGYEQQVSYTIGAPGHKWDNGTRVGNTTIYKCQNKGCNEEYSKTYEPTEPTKPEEPTVPSTKPTTPIHNGENPKTGDESIIPQVLAGIGVSSVATAGLIATTLYKLKKEQELQGYIKEEQGYKGKYLSKK